jgi:hypothetical protein
VHNKENKHNKRGKNISLFLFLLLLGGLILLLLLLLGRRQQQDVVRGSCCLQGVHSVQGLQDRRHRRLLLMMLLLLVVVMTGHDQLVVLLSEELLVLLVHVGHSNRCAHGHQVLVVLLVLLVVVMKVGRRAMLVVLAELSSELLRRAATALVPRTLLVALVALPLLLKQPRVLMHRHAFVRQARQRYWRPRLRCAADTIGHASPSSGAAGKRRAWQRPRIGARSVEACLTRFECAEGLLRCVNVTAHTAEPKKGLHRVC